MDQAVAEKTLTNLGNLRYSVSTDDPDGDHVHRVEIRDCWERTTRCHYHDSVLAKAVDGALRRALGFFSSDEETIVVSYFSSARADNNGCEYQVSLEVKGGEKLKAAAPSEVLAVFGALWNYYQPDIPLMGGLKTLIKSVRFA